MRRGRLWRLWSGLSGAVRAFPVAASGLAVAAALAAGMVGALRITPGFAAQVALGFGAVLGIIVALIELAQKKMADRSPRERGVFVACTVLVATGLMSYTVLTQAPGGGGQDTVLKRMHGTRDVAVVGFEATGKEKEGDNAQLLDDVSAELAGRLASQLGSTKVRDYAGDVAAPLSELDGNAHVDLDQWTDEFVTSTNAEILLGGLVAMTPSGQTVVRPAFYVRPDQVSEAPELAGWYLTRPLFADDPLSSTSGRQRVLGQLVADTQVLRDFLDALDAWNSGLTDDAVVGLRAVRHDVEGGAGGFVSSDLVHLFLGHALQQQALAATPNDRRDVLTLARNQYAAVDPESSLGARARLSLAGNRYLRSLGDSCKPGTVSEAGLSAARSTLADISDDTSLTDIGSLTAAVNLAQVEFCRMKAHLTNADAVEMAVKQALALAAEPPDLAADAYRDREALALSIRAEVEAATRDLHAAVASISEALREEADFTRRALWLGRRGSWLLEQCDLVHGLRDHTNSLTQLRSAIAAGEADTDRLAAYREQFGQQKDVAQKKCT
jgi:hypothetical protein